MAISFISAGGADGAVPSTPIPTHAVGDLIIVFAFRGDGNEPPLATGYTEIATGGGTSAYRWKLGYKYAQSTSETFGAWGSSTDVLIAHVYRGAAPTSDFSIGGSSTGPIVYPALTAPSAAAWIAAFVGTHNSNNTGANNPPTGMTNRVTRVANSRRAAGHDTNSAAASSPSEAKALGGTDGQWRAAVAAIVPLTVGTVAYTELDDGYSTLLTHDKEINVAYTETNDTVTSSAYKQRNINVTYTELDDGYSASLDGGRRITVTYTEQNDTVVSSLLRNRDGSVSYTELMDGYSVLLADAMEANVSYTEVIDGYTAALESGKWAVIAYAEQNDTVNGLIEKGAIAAVSYTEFADGYTTALMHGVVGTVTYTEINDTVSSYLTGNASAEVVYTELMDGYTAVLAVGRSGTVVYTEINDTLTTVVNKEMGVNVVYTEASDTLSGYIEKELFARVVYKEQNDTITSAASLPITARVEYTEQNDTLITAPVANVRVCCSPQICEITPSMLVCNFVNLLPTGPLWDRAKRKVVSHYMACAQDPAPPPCPFDDDACSSIVSHSVYTALRLYDLLYGSVWPALRESDPTTAFTTMDDWLDRMKWADCFYGLCRDPDLGALSPVEFAGNCYTYYCDVQADVDLQNAVKHGIILALHRLQMGIFARLDDINFVIEPLGARLDVALDAVGDCPLEFDLRPTSQFLPGWQVMACESTTASPVQAWFDPNGCEYRGLPTRIWPGLMAAECIVRSVLQRNQGTIINRIWC